ncbi:MAG: DUF2339 domain-containing protein [Acidobacteriia bacterium]|nr:DUF2339 domain-containing protein [Terriglobia bacterium]
MAFLRVRRLERRVQEIQTEREILRRLHALEQKVAALESGAGAPAADRAAVSPPSVAPEPSAVSPPSARPLPPPGPAPSERDLESLIGGRLLNRIGIAALLLAAAFFLKLAYDNRWIGPAGQVAILLVCGAALLVWSQWLLRRGYPYFSEGIAGLGGAVLYLALYFGWSYHNLFGPGTAFTGMIPITITLLAIAVGRDSQRIAVIALLGGFATPMLASTGRDQQVTLFSYLTVLDAGLVALGWLRRWRSLELLAFAATQIYFWGWYNEFYTEEKLFRTAAFATLFFLLFSAIPFLRAQRERQFTRGPFLLVLANAFLFLIALRQMLWTEHRWMLTLAVLALSALHLVISRMSPPGEAGQPSPVRILYAGLALTFATLAIPIRLEGRWITLAWAIEGVVLIWSGFRTRLWLLRAAGLVLFALVAFRLFVFPIPAATFLLNARLLTWLFCAGCFAAAAYMARQEREQQEKREPALYAAVAAAANLLLLWTLSQEIWDVFGRMHRPLGMETRQAQQMMLSLLWAVYGTVLVVVGFVRKLAGLRWQALALFGLTVIKVFLYDLSFLSRASRIFSFLVLGVVLLLASFLYARRQRRHKEVSDA